MLECPRWNSIGNKFPSLFENVVLWALQSFFQLDQLFLPIKPWPYTSLKSQEGYCTRSYQFDVLGPISLLVFRTLESISCHTREELTRFQQAQDIVIRMTSFQAEQNISAQESQGLLSTPCDMQLQVQNLAQPASNLFQENLFHITLFGNAWHMV